VSDLPDGDAQTAPGGETFRSGFVGLAGRPNVGKSTLTNALCRDHVAIVSDKPQTTRRRVLGVVHAPGAQLVLADLPGFQRPRDALTEKMQRAVDESLADVDALLLVLDARDEPGPGDRFIASRVLSGTRPAVIALNKVDGMTPAKIAERISQVARLGDFHALHPVSAITGDGVDALRDELLALLPEGPPYFPEEARTDQPASFRIAELIRERALALTREEVPHALAVSVDELLPPRGGRAGRVRAVIAVETESQQRMLIGKGGAMVKAIGRSSRPGIERLMGGAIYLDLTVKVRRGWRADASLIDRLGA
jgi:GTP-binding protein Era